jgi:hypothetical protein
VAGSPISLGLVGWLLSRLGFSSPIIEEMTEALDKEMSYIESRGGVRCIVYNGKPQRELGENTYTFRRGGRRRSSWFVVGNFSAAASLGAGAAI